MTATDTEAEKGEVTSDIEDVMALSPLQEGLYSLTALAEFTEGQPADDPYVIGMAADIFGSLDVALLRDCAAKMLIRHPNLRASFFSRGIPRPVQIVPSRVALPWRDLTAATEADIEAAELDERRRPFDLERLPAIRFLLIELPSAHWRLVITAHHIVIDGWSLPVFVAEMMILYRAGGDLGALPVAPRPYRDYIGWLAGRDQDASQRRSAARTPRAPPRGCRSGPSCNWTPRPPIGWSRGPARAGSRSTPCCRRRGRSSCRA